MNENNDNNEELEEKVEGESTSQASAASEQSASQTGQEAGNSAMSQQLARQGAKKVANAAGDVAKQAGKKAKQVAVETGKKAAMTLLKSIGIKGIAIALLFVLLAAATFGVLNSLFEGISDAVDALGDAFTSTSTTSTQTMGTGINITDENIQELIDKINEMGLSVEDLYLSGDIDYQKDANNPENIKQRNKYLRQFLLASLCTQYPDFGIEEDETHYNGIIKIRRASNTDTLENAKDMEYVTKDVFEEMIDAVNKGSIDDTINATYTSKRVDTNIESTREGVVIPSIIFLPEGAENVPLVIMCHGFTGKKEGDNDHFITLGQMLSENGIAAITIDFSGCGSSADPSTNYTLSNMQADMDAAINYVKSTYSIDGSKIGIVGHSMGGRVASEYLDKVQAAVLWAPADGDGLTGLEFLNPDDNANHYNELYHTAKESGSVDSGWDTNGKDFILSKEFFDDMSNSHPLGKLSSYTNPIMVAFGDQDNVITEARDAIQAAMPVQGEFRTYNQDHNFTIGNSDEQTLLEDTANLFTQTFFGHDISEGGASVESPLKGYTIDQLKEKIKNVYSVDNNGNLYFATWTTVQSSDTTMSVSSMCVNYKKTVEKYALPIEVSLTLCLLTQNPEYVYQFIEDHVLSGEIVITILDTQRVDTYESWYDWIVEEVSTFTLPQSSTPTTSTQEVPTSKYEYNKVIRTTISSEAVMTSVDTWMVKSSINYTNTLDQIEYPLGEETVVNNAECPVEIKESETTTGYTTINDHVISYVINIARTIKSCTLTQIENILYNEWSKGTVFVDTDAISQKADNIIKQWGEKFKIPNSTTIEAPAEKIESGEQMILQFLNNENTQKQQEIFKFLFERAKDKNYSISNLDLSIYNDMELIVVGAEEDIIVDVTRSASELVLSKEKIKSAISACYSGDIEENLLNTLDSIYDVQQQNKVNAIFTIAVAIQESSAGTHWELLEEYTHNWMSIEGKGYVAKNGTEWQSYVDYDVATKDFGDYISNRGPFFKNGNYSVSTIGQLYCLPPGGWITGVTSIMTRLYRSVGVDIGSIIDSGTTGGVGDGTGNTGGSGYIGTETGTGYWGTFTSSAGKTYKLYYQNYISATNNWGIDSDQMCVATAAAIVHSADGQGRDPTDFWGTTGGAINVGLTSIERDINAITQYLKNGNPVVLYSNFGDKYYGSPHALALLDADSNGKVFVANPYYISDGNGGQKAGGWILLEDLLKYPKAETLSFKSCGVLLS